MRQVILISYQRHSWGKIAVLVMRFAAVSLDAAVLAGTQTVHTKNFLDLNSTLVQSRPPSRPRTSRSSVAFKKRHRRCRIVAQQVSNSTLPPCPANRSLNAILCISKSSSVDRNSGSYCSACRISWKIQSKLLPDHCIGIIFSSASMLRHIL